MFERPELLWLLLAMPLAFVALFAAKMVSKLVPLVPTVRAFEHGGRQGLYYSFMMSTGLTFGTISALFGLNHAVITAAQYSYLVATVIASAVVPTALLVKKTYLIFSEISYKYLPVGGGYVMAKTGITLHDVAYTRPRQSTCVFYSPATACTTL